MLMFRLTHIYFFLPRLKDLPANIVGVLQKLESDYSESRDKILQGVPLEQLRPLSVDSEKITTAASCYTPAKVRLRPNH